MEGEGSSSDRTSTSSVSVQLSYVAQECQKKARGLGNGNSPRRATIRTPSQARAIPLIVIDPPERAEVSPQPPGNGNSSQASSSRTIIRTPPRNRAPALVIPPESAVEVSPQPSGNGNSPQASSSRIIIRTPPRNRAPALVIPPESVVEASPQPPGPSQSAVEAKRKRKPRTAAKAVMPPPRQTRPRRNTIKVSEAAFAPLKEATKMFLEDLFEEGTFSANHARRVTVQPKDFLLARRIRNK